MKKNSLLLSLLFTLLFWGNTIAGELQEIRVNFKVNDVGIVDAIEKLVSGTNYSVVFAAKDIDKSIKVTLDLKGVTIADALSKVLENSGLKYSVSNNNIVISKDNQPNKRVNVNRIVSGKVIDKDTKETVIGAKVMAVGPNLATVTDIDGIFSLNVKDAQKIEISCFGYQKVIYDITNADNVVIYMESDVTALNEVVVNGYKKTTISRVTGSVGVVTSDQLRDSPTKSMDLLMQGKVSGVTVQAVSGRPGEVAKIRIRGTNTITGNADPLWVVDGVMLQKDIPRINSSQVKAGDFNDLFTNGVAGINPNDIESITILKDASAAAIYGSRAAGGVIVVTTKRGKEGKLRVNYSGSMSVLTKPIRDVSLMTSKEKIEWEKELWDEFSADRFSKGEDYPVLGIVGMVRSGIGKYQGMTLQQQDNYLQELSGETTDWFKELFRTSISHNHYLSFSGGANKVNYFISIGYGNNQGLVKNNTYDRYNLSSKIDFRASDRVKLDFNTSISFQQSNSASGSANLFNYAYFANPYEKPYNPDGSYKADETYFELGRINGNTSYIIPDNGINILRELNETSSEVKSFDVTQTVSLSWNIVDKLNFEGLASVSYSNNNTDNINGKDTYAAFTDRPFELNSVSSQRKYGSIFQSSAYNNSYNIRGQLSYNKQLNKDHYISLLAGSEIRSAYSKNIFEKRYGYDPVSGNSSFPIYPPTESGLIPYDYLVNYAKIMDGLAGQSIDESAMASFYFSTDYSYKNLYTVSMTTRTDGSNNFGANQQFNPIWSFGATWNAINESFLSGIRHVVDNLSIRAATGYTGNINKSVYPQFVMTYNTDFRKTYNDFFRMGYVHSAPNPNLRWERTFDYKVGADISIFKNRLRFVTEYYYRLSSDVVTPVRVPETTGFSTQSYNTSKILNRGVEFSLNASIIRKQDYSLSLSANISHNRNELKEYNSPTGNAFGSMRVGYPLNSIFTGDPQGIDRYTGVYIFKPRSDAKFESKNDYLDGDNYLFYIGTSNAPINGGYSISGRYKNFTLSIGGVYTFGAKILNEINSPASYGTLQKSSPTSERVPTSHNDLYRNHLNVLKSSRYRWTESNPVTDGMPRLIDAYGPNLGYETYMTTSSIINRGALIENVSYFKVNSIVLGYNFSEKALKGIGIESLGLSFVMNNILTISNYSGFDPETPGAVYPQSKSFSFGVNIGF